MNHDYFYTILIKQIEKDFLRYGHGMQISPDNSFGRKREGCRKLKSAWVKVIAAAAGLVRLKRRGRFNCGTAIKGVGYGRNESGF